MPQLKPTAFWQEERAAQESRTLDAQTHRRQGVKGTGTGAAPVRISCGAWFWCGILCAGGIGKIELSLNRSLAEMKPGFHPRQGADEVRTR